MDYSSSSHKYSVTHSPEIVCKNQKVLGFTPEEKPLTFFLQVHVHVCLCNSCAILTSVIISTGLQQSYRHFSSIKTGNYFTTVLKVNFLREFAISNAVQPVFLTDMICKKNKKKEKYSSFIPC